jgi:type VI secretion system protein VasD
MTQSKSSICALAACLILSGCSGAGAIQLAGAAVGGAVNAVLETTGLSTGRDRESGGTVSVSIEAAPALNASISGEPLSLVLRIYQLRSEHGFARLAYEQAQQDDMGAGVLGAELESARELIILPGRRYALTLETRRDTRYIGIVALFHSPARERWKLAVERGRAPTERIALTLGVCAMATAPDADSGGKEAAATVVSDLRCKHS